MAYGAAAGPSQNDDNPYFSGIGSSHGAGGGLGYQRETRIESSLGMHDKPAPLLPRDGSKSPGSGFNYGQLSGTQSQAGLQKL